MKDNQTYSVAELFCGCGGFSHGFSMTRKFRVVLGVDVKPLALETFVENARGRGDRPEVFREDVRLLSMGKLEQALASHDIYSPGDLDCLIGGPPCQGFSQLRRGEQKHRGKVIRFTGYNRQLEDPRNALVLRFLEVAAAFLPKTLVIENVPQMLRHAHEGRAGRLADSIVNTLRDLGYDVAVGVLNAADYGVPQLRERAIFVASRIGQAALPPPTHAEAPAEARTAAAGWVTVRDAISDLPAPVLGKLDVLGGSPVDSYQPGEVAPFAKSMRSAEAFPFNHVTRSYDDRILGIIREMRPGETWDHASARMKKRFERIIEEHRRASEPVSRAKARLAREGMINLAFYRDYYWSAYSRLHWERPALTITANANFLGSGRFTHPSENRGITVREAARLQSFDDDFVFITDREGGTTQMGIGFDMIGEAVPPLLGKAIAEKLASLLASNGASALAAGQSA